MLHAHVREAGEVTEEPTADKTQEWPDVHLRLLLGQPYAQLGAEGGQAGIHVSHHMGEQLVQRFQDKLDKAALGGAVSRFLCKLPGLRIEVDVSPESAGKLVDIDVAVGGVVQRGERLQGEAGAVLRAGETHISLDK